MTSEPESAAATHNIFLPPPVAKAADVPSGGSAVVSAKPGGLGFDTGSGRGQWLVLAMVVLACVVCVLVSARVGAYLLTVLLGVCAILRLVLPARWVPALVNRGRPFDVSMFASFSVLITALSITSPLL